MKTKTTMYVYKLDVDIRPTLLNHHIVDVSYDKWNESMLIEDLGKGYTSEEYNNMITQKDNEYESGLEKIQKIDKLNFKDQLEQLQKELMEEKNNILHNHPTIGFKEYVELDIALNQLIKRKFKEQK